MPSSFSRFVSEEDLDDLRGEFMAALAELEAEEKEEGNMTAESGN
ncbi:hypothetical protein SAMN04487983_102880 [Streptomyces sp. yr375]|nr:hypothetical protein [Streptomyces sp. yr375]SES03599.1 hypothetical protein SAMN04487983_102880 [Streptomyces sp. yr375]